MSAGSPGLNKSPVSDRTTSSENTRKRNSKGRFSAKSERRRSHKKRSSEPELKEYRDRVRVILQKVNEADDKEENIATIKSELNKIGAVYFGDKYDPGALEDDGDPIEAYTKKKFRKQYEKEVGEPYEVVPIDEFNDGDTAAFSDAFCHAALIDVDTLKVASIETINALTDLARTDYVFTWKTINTLPAKLAGTRLVAIHFDDLSVIMFPLPN